MSARAGLLGLALLACAGAGAEEPYRPSHRDYAAFRSAWPDLLEPNYLPFMVHRAPGGEGGDLLFFCRWTEQAMPLPVHVVTAPIPPELQDEFWPRPAAAYVEAVERALAIWERELEPWVRFRRVEAAEEARLVIHLLGQQAPEPEPEVQVLGSTRLQGACRVLGREPGAAALRVDFAVPELRLYLADRFGLLSADQVQWIALHEIGHALGMRGHSPVPADLMFEVARDRVLLHEGLSSEDVNSFLSLYQLPNGTVFGRVRPEDGPEPSPEPGPPRLALAPYVDARWGFELRPPAGWLRVPTERGMAAVDGSSWDYTASFQVVVQRYATVEDYLERYGAYYARRGRVGAPAPLVVNGRRAFQTEIELAETGWVEQVTLIEVGDGRLIVITADCPSESLTTYRPWFRAALASLEITDLPEEAWPRGARR